MARQESLYRTPDWANIITRAVATASAQTSAITVAGDYELSSDTDCYVLVGSNPTAAAGTSMFIAADGTLTLLRML